MRRVLAILACGLLALPAVAAGPGTLAVDDKASAFTPDGVAKAKGLMTAAEFQAPTHLTVMTGGDKDVPLSVKPTLEAARKAKDNAAGRKAVADWAAEAAMQHPDKGVFVLVYTEGKTAIVVTKSDRTVDLRGFGASDDSKLSDLLAKAFRADQKDQGLYEATAYVVDRLKNTTVPAATPADPGRRPSDPAHNNHRGGSGMSIGGLICFGLLVVGFLWLIFGVIRALTTPRGYGPGGYGPGGYGGGYGGGGGGFMSGLMGGLFGAVAGNYLYNNFFGGGSSLGAGGYDGGGYTGAGGYPDATGGDGDYGGGSEGAAGGFDDAGGGAGGFDDGGGAGGFDDAGGGGDWGGGGGDFGGGDGGGGDW